MATLTSANSVFTLTIASIFPAPQVLQGYAVDDAFSSEMMTIAENVMGVDGLKGSGYTPAIFVQTIALQANSDSIKVFDLWGNAMLTAKETFDAIGVITIPSIGKSFTLTQGTLTQWRPMPDAKKILQAQHYQVQWGSIRPALV